jgi:hypothetical protein
VAVTDILSNRATPLGAASDTVPGKLPLVVWLYLLAVVIPVGVSVGPLVLTGVRIVLIVMILPLLAQLFMGRFGKLFATDFLFIAHVLWTAVALAMNNPSQVIQQTGSVGMEFLGGYVLGRGYIRTREDFAALSKVLILFVLAMVPLALLETITGQVLLVDVLKKVPGMRTIGYALQERRFGLDRVPLGFSHPIHFGLFCSVTFSLCFVAMEGTFSTMRRWITGAIIAATGFLALSSGAILAITLQFALILWATMFAKVEKRWWILVGLFVLAYVVIDLLSNRRPVDVFMSYATFSAQTAYWRAQIFEWGMKSVWANPVFGIGLNDWIRPWYMYTNSVDNFWLLMAMRYGIPGFLTVTLGYVLVVYHVMRRDLRADPVLAVFRRAWVFTFLGLSFTLCTVHVWTSMYSFVFFMLGAGVWLIVAPTQEDRVTDTPVETPRAVGSVFARPLRQDTLPQSTPRGLVAPQRKADVAPKTSSPRYSRFDPSDDA